MYNTDQISLDQTDELSIRHYKPLGLTEPESSMEPDSILYREVLQTSLHDLFSFQSVEPESTLKISQLDSVDEPWECMFLKFTDYVKKNGHTNISADKEHAELKDWINKQILNKRFLTKTRFRKLDLLGINWNTVLSRDHGWDLMFSRLITFSDTFGHCCVPHLWHDDKQLALWVLRQRKMYSLNKISEYRKNRLKEIGFTWQVQDLYNKQWENYFRQLLKFHMEHGHFTVPGKEKKLVSWIERQRLLKKKKKMPADREKRLNQINFVWGFDQIKNKDWEEKYSQLKEFNQIHGHSFVPLNYKANKSLGIWVALQRKAETNGTILKSRLQKLNQLNFIWSRDTLTRVKSNYDSQWELNFEKLKTYKRLHGTCQVSLKSDPKLQGWTVWQRKMFINGKISPERVSRLNEIAFPWSVNEPYWEKMFAMLTAFHDRFGHSRVPSQWPENPKLAAWTYRIRAGKHELTPQKTELLNSLGFEWDINRKTIVEWSQMYQRLLEFKQDYGHTHVPVKWSKDPKLGKWASRMRNEKKKISPERLIKLESIGFDWNKTHSRLRVTER